MAICVFFQSACLTEITCKKYPLQCHFLPYLLQGMPQSPPPLGELAIAPKLHMA